MKIVGAWLALLTSSVSWAAPLQLQFWHSMTGPKGELIQVITKQFNESPENQGQIVVHPQFVGTYEEGLNKLRTALLAHRAPHIAQITDIGTQVLIDSGACVPLYKFSDGDTSFPNSQFLPHIRRYYEIGGHLYSLPFATSNPIIYYNVDAFRKANLTEPPRNFAELESYSRKLTIPAEHITGITWPLHSWFYEQFLARQGRDLTDHGNGRLGRATQINLTSPESVDFVQLWYRMVKEGTFSNVGRGWGPAEQNFLAARSAMLIYSTSDVFEIIAKASFPVATAPLPAKDPSVPGGTIVGGNALWILAAHPDLEQKAAYRFIQFMASKPIQRLWHTKTGYFPIRRDVIAELRNEGFYKKYPAAWTAIEQMENSADIPATSGALMGPFAEVRETINNAVEKVLAGMLDTETAMKRAKEEVDSSLQRYNRAIGLKDAGGES
jgi:sn-glycerol 3-phosphate transport system substrate-binding protein